MRSQPLLADQAAQRLQQGSWDWLIGAELHAGCEPRALWTSNALPSLPCLSVARAEARTPHRFRLTAGEESVVCEWRELFGWLQQRIQPRSRVLLDISQLGFEMLLYLIPAVRRLDLAQLCLIYAVPERYAEGESLEFAEAMRIEQPKGYVALRSESGGEARHVIILGFDVGRAWKFIDSKYGWDLRRVHLLLGVPPLLPGGRERALASCQPWIDSFVEQRPDHLHAVEAAEPGRVRQFLLDQLALAPWLDVVPLGPRPMLLGVLAFYFSLTPGEQGRVRLLYDFPAPRRSRTEGLHRVLLFDGLELFQP